MDGSNPMVKQMAIVTGNGTQYKPRVMNLRKGTRGDGEVIGRERKGKKDSGG